MRENKTIILLCIFLPLFIQSNSYAKEKCPVSPENSWTQQESKVWKKLCSGEIAYLGKEQPVDEKHWTEDRILRKQFLHTILSKEQYLNQIKLMGIRIMGAWIVEDMDIAYRQLDFPLFFKYSRFDKDISLEEVETSKSISLQDCIINGQLKMNGIRIDSALFLQRSKLKSLSLNSAHITLVMNMSGSHVENKLEMFNAKVGNMMMNGGTFASIDMEDAQVSGSIQMKDSKIKGMLDMNGLETGSALFMSGSKFEDISLVNANIEKRINLNNAAINGKLDMSQLQTRNLALNEASFTSVNMELAEVQRVLSMKNSTFNNKTLMNGLEVGGAIFMDDTTFKEGAEIISAKVGAMVSLSNAKINGVLDMSRLNTMLLRTGKKGKAPTWGKGAKIVLREAKIAALDDTPDSWPPYIDIYGFEYTDFLRLGNEDKPSIDWFKAWLKKQKPYSPQPYKQFANVLTAMGHETMAEEISYESKERERKTAGIEMKKLWLTLQWLFVGYGYIPELTFLWVLFFTVVGAVVIKLANNEDMNTLHYNSLVYSLDMFLPIIKLREGHYDNIDLSGGASYYFYVHKILGYVLVSFLIAGISGITK